MASDFAAHVELLHLFIARRAAIVERIQSALNVQHKPPRTWQDRTLLGRQFEDCFFSLPDATPAQAALRGQLQQAHWARGFKPRDMPGIPNEMFDPGDMMARAFVVWRHTRWPGRNGRVHFAHALFNLHVVRCLALLDMRLADDGPDASARLARLQETLDALWQSASPDLPVLVRDVRWLVPVAQSPTTDELGSYFEAAAELEACLDPADRLEIHKASVLMAGGHLRSQLRHFTMKGRSLDDRSLLLSTRGSNALDCAMTIQHLVPLLEAYGQAIDSDEVLRRRMLADVICQGISPDPELFVQRLELLGPYSMVEHLFVAADAGGHAVLTSMGQRHVLLVQRYRTLMAQLARPLLDDCPRFRPVPGSYSPYGVMFGFSANILEHMTLKSLQPESATSFSLEDAFAAEEPGSGKLAWISGWRRLPHVSGDVLQMYEYPQRFAEQMFERIDRTLRERGDVAATTRTGRLFLHGASAGNSTPAAQALELPSRFVQSSDPALVTACRALYREAARILDDRREGMHLVSFQTAQGWVAISKDLLSEVLGNGQDAQAGWLPQDAARVLQTLYPELVAPVDA